MPKNFKWKILLIVIVVSVCLWWAVPPKEPGERLFSKINLGLDLQGGIHLVLKVDTEGSLRDELLQDAREIEEGFEEKEIDLESTRAASVSDVELLGVDGQKEAEARQYLESTYGAEYTLRSRFQEGRVDYTLSLRDGVLRRLKETTVTQALEIIRRRVDELGVMQPTLQIYGGSDADVQEHIIVELPGVDDPERVKEILQTTAQLELRLVKKDQGGPFSSVESAVAANGGKIDKEKWEIFSYREDRDQTQVEYLVVSTAPTITGRHLKNARRSTDSNGAPAVGFFLNAEGAEVFGRETERHVNERLAIVLDKTISSAPVINERIGAEGIIHGQFSIQQAEDLALVLRSGALPADLRILEERTVGASLGNDSIQKGVAASLIGFSLVVIGMLVYYKLSGINAIICLLINLVVLLGFMGQAAATLTLPGIAGIILTIGMAVDANILIFERIREELAAGKTVRAGVEAGFEKVFWTIVHSNTTTLIAAAFLFQFGTGPIRGFAVTLTAGLIANLFTAIFVSRRFFELVLGERRVETLSI